MYIVTLALWVSLETFSAIPKQVFVSKNVATSSPSRSRDRESGVLLSAFNKPQLPTRVLAKVVNLHIFMAEEIIVKRLHVSGLTPAIRPADLSQKLGSFGTIKALDGFDQVDGLGQPRKFGYVTIETTKAKLARCMNLLSGVTWKGTKLRIGEAKPDFRERIALEHAKMKTEDSEPPHKKRRLPRGVQGAHALDMSLVTPENAHSRGGWRVTPLGRIVRPVRMRPEHPLPEPSPSMSVIKTHKTAAKKPRRAKPPLVRARRVTIDPTKWSGSQHLKGIFLENEAGPSVQYRPLMGPEEQEMQDSSEDAGSENDEYQQEAQTEQHKNAREGPRGSPPRSIPISREPAPPIIASSATHLSNNVLSGPSDTDIIQEKAAALGLLQSLFGDRDEWGGKESIDSDVDMDNTVDSLKQTLDEHAEDQGEFEEIPTDVGTANSQIGTASSIAETHQLEDTPVPASVPDKPAKLKDLFAPREEEVGFSLLGHLDLDLDLDDDVLDESFAPAQPASAPPVVQPVPPTTMHNARTHGQFAFDPHLPFFFPIPPDEREKFGGKARDSLDAEREMGIDWRGFCRTQTSEEIRQRWEQQKVELTKDWKRRHREAIKSRRRRGGGDRE